VTTALANGKTEFLIEGVYHGQHLAARPLPLTMEKLRELWELHSRHKIFFDDTTIYSFERFGLFVINSVQYPIEIVRLPEVAHVGILYLTDVHWSETENPPYVVDAYFHGSMWDGDAAHRRELVKQVIRMWTKMLRLRRLAAITPAKAVGAINALVKLGFTGPFTYTLHTGKKVNVEGVCRKAKKISGEWVDMVQLALVEEELWRI
jgi:hypothetical protein